MGGECISHVHEVSFVDPRSKRVTMCATNMTWSNALSVREMVVYQPHPSSPNDKTLFRQDAKITALCGGWEKMRNRIEDFTVDRFGQNAQRGREGFEAVLEMSRHVFGEQKDRLRGAGTEEEGDEHRSKS